MSDPQLQANCALVREAVEEVWNRHRLDRIDEFYADDFYAHVEPMQDWVGRAGVREAVGRVHTTFDEFEERIEVTIAERDLVAARATMSGVSKIHGFDDKPDGVPISTPTVFIYRIANGKIAEQWEIANMKGMLEQMGFGEPIDESQVEG